MRCLLVLLSASFVFSSCPAGDFSCASGKCVPGDAVCDFKMDCDNGADEEFCGSCDFEFHSCGWKDTSDQLYRWRLERANVTSVPGHDHTTGSPWGHVMGVNGTKGTSFLSKAILEYHVDKPGALGCQIRFWYHFHGEKSVSSSLYLKMVSQARPESLDLVKISKDRTNGWENHTAFLGNRPGGYKLVFLTEPAIIYSKDVLLDDIRFESCWEGDVPAGAEQLSCDFEKDTCAWYRDHTAATMWERANKNGPGYDHTIGKGGYFMFIAAKSSLDVSSTARLISYPQQAGGTLCVSFWYHIYGTSIGSLKFITKQAGEPESVVWMRSGTQGRKWRFADLTFSSDTPIQFILEAVAGGRSGSIAVDDVLVYRSENASCPAERECTFQGSLCGLQPDSSADFPWSRTRGAHTANLPSPDKDHTLGTELGFYLSSQLWRHPAGTRGRMVTAVNEVTPHSGECWSFWYHMEGKAELRVYLQTLGGSPSSATSCSPSSPPSAPLSLLWSRTGDQGEHWRQARATVLSPNTQYQVIFEAVVGEGSQRDIAIDDITLLNGPCPEQGFCDFEMDYCGWVNVPPAGGSGVDWDWLSGGGRFIPPVDHTTNSALGHFLLFSAERAGEEKAHVQSERMGPVDRACLEFWYYMETWSINKVELSVYVNETGGMSSVWRESGDKGQIWHRALVDYRTTGPHQIVFEAANQKEEGGVALDDVHVRLGTPCADLLPTTPPPPASTTSPAPTPPPSPMDCSFEQGLCLWVQSSSDDVDWLLQKGSQVHEPWDGPLYDHTLKNNQGFYLLLNGSGAKDGELAVISVPVEAHTLDVCVGFWYYMLGASVSRLELLVQTTSSRSVVWTRSGSQDSEWAEARVTVHNTDIQEVMISGRRDTHSTGFMAIDDFTVREGACLEQNPCGFESHNWCDFDIDVTQPGRWGRVKGTTDQPDHTFHTDSGFYLTVLSQRAEVAQILTPELTSTTETCLRFWYWLPEASSGALSVHILRSGDQGPSLWQRSGAPSAGWEVAELTVSSPNNFQVVFKARHAPDSSSRVRLDDVSMREGACAALGSCDFEAGQCTWVSLALTDGHAWVQADGSFGGPPTDHTTQAPQGRFLLSPALPQNPTSLAVVASEWILQTHPATCLTFWYHMNNSDSGTLRVFLRSEPPEQELIFESRSSGSGWTQFSDSLKKSTPFQVLIEAESASRGYIAVDDVVMSPGFCQGNGTSEHFPECTFENGTCGWEDTSLGQFAWQRGRNGTAIDNTGPSVDHTLGSDLGWYMVVEASGGEQNSFAALQSPAMKQASSHCLLEFYYHMFGTGIGELKVFLKEGSRTTPLWWLSGDQGDVWGRGEVIVGRTPQVFTVLFEATRTFSRLGDIAIDDVSFLNCSLPEPQDVCPESMFTCSNRVCVPRGRVCDLSDDCGDGSDEIRCEQHGVLELCSFEQGLCSWGGSDVDTPGGEWGPQKGETAWPLHGPPRDHTLNTAAGHFVIPGPHLTLKGQTSEMLSNTLLPGPSCTVRFYYYSQDDESASLTVKSRRQRSGRDDALLWVRDSPMAGFSWQRAEVVFSSSESSKVAFQYQRGGGERGLVAIDDISFSNDCIVDPSNTPLPESLSSPAPPTCSPSPQTTPTVPPTGPCLAEDFYCWRTPGVVCVPASSQCNLKVDCPQGEDEEGCDVCDFEKGMCDWTQLSHNDLDWLLGSGSSPSLNTGPGWDHTTNSPSGHYLYLAFSASGRPRQVARVASPVIPEGKGACLQLWYHMFGRGVGTLNVYQQAKEGERTLLLSHEGDQGQLWRFTQAKLQLHGEAYRIVVEGVTGDDGMGTGDMAFDDVQVTSKQCPSPGQCDFQRGLCGWSNLGGGLDHGDWLLGRGLDPNTGPRVDHTTNTSLGYYLYTDGSVGEWGEKVLLYSEVLQPNTGGHCVTFWYHMHGSHIGTLNLYRNTREVHATGDSTGYILWTESGNQGDVWLEENVFVDHKEPFWFVFVHQRGREVGGNVALDDITVQQGPCWSTIPPVNDDSMAVSVGVSLTLLAVMIFVAALYVHHRKCHSSEPKLIDNEVMNEESDIDMHVSGVYNSNSGSEMDI